MHFIRRRWKRRASEAALEKMQGHDFLTRLLIAYGYETAEAQRAFLNQAQENHFHHDPFALRGMRETAERLNEAIDRREKIVLHGDYDLDGLSASALVYRYFKKYGLVLDIFLPSRTEDGYGIGESSLAFIRDRRPDVLLTVDCGVTAVQACAALRAEGYTVCITDHHMPGEELPATPYLVDPLLPGSAYENRALAGVGVALKLIQAMERLRRPSVPEEVILHEVAESCADLFMLGTIADLMEMTRENSAIIRLGMEKLRRGEASLGLAALLKVKRLSAETMDGQSLAIQICPSFNAAGRISDVYHGLRLLITEDPSEAQSQARLLNELNKQRKEMGDQAYAEAQDYLCHHPEELSGRCLCLAMRHCHAGIIGIVAARLVDYYAKPCLLFTEDPTQFPEGIQHSSELDPRCGSQEGRGIRLRGSARSFREIDFHGMTSEVKSHLERFGGHKQAFGAEIYEENFSSFKEALLCAAEKQAEWPEEQERFQTEYEMELTSSDLRLENAELLSCFEPSGRGRELPLFRTDGLTIVEAKAIGKEGRHLRLTLRDDAASGKTEGRETIECVAFSMGSLLPLCKPGRRTDILFSMHVNVFMRRARLQLQIRDLHLHPASPAETVSWKPELSQSVTALYRLFSSADPRGFYVRIEDFCRVYWPLLLPAGKDAELRAEDLELILKIMEELELIRYVRLSETMLFLVMRERPSQKRKLTESETYRKSLEKQK